ncbi:sugar transporter, partial [Methylobacterium sp. J-077]|nr:sugar transporter [Methylobacterium sp. J-077]
MLRKTALSALMAALAAGSIGGCTYLPAAGPTASAIEAGAEVATADGGVLARYEIIDVTPAVIEALRG